MEPSIASRVARGFTLYEVATVQGTTLEMSTMHKEIKDAVALSRDCVVYRYSGEQKQAVIVKSEGRIVKGNIHRF